MEVKVGQVWQQRSSDTRYEVAAVSDKECVLNTKDGFFLMSISGAENLLMTCALVNEPEKSLSDLEIVQKALSKVYGYLCCSENHSEVIGNFGKTLYDGSHESLLTWAKQTVGDQP